MIYTYDDGLKILELIKSLNAAGNGPWGTRVEVAFKQYNYYLKLLQERK